MILGECRSLCVEMLDFGCKYRQGVAITTCEKIDGVNVLTIGDLLMQMVIPAHKHKQLQSMY